MYDISGDSDSEAVGLGVATGVFVATTVVVTAIVAVVSKAEGREGCSELLDLIN